MKVLYWFFSLLLIITIASPVYAQQNGVNVEDLIKDPKLTSQQREAIVQALNSYKQAIPIDTKNIEKWGEIGDAFAETIKKICQTLNVEVNAFLKSDVGKLTAAIIIYKMVGQEILRILIYSSALFMMTLVCAVFANFAFIKKKIKDPDTKKISYVERLEWKDASAKYIAMFITGAVWIAFTGILLGNII